VVEHVVADRDRLVHEIQPHAPPHTPEIDERAQLIDFDHQARDT
jgi:hypothetical protein